MRRYSEYSPLVLVHSSRRSPVMACCPAASLRVAFGAGGVAGAPAVGAVGVVPVVGCVCVFGVAAGVTLVRRVLVPAPVLSLMAALEPERIVAVSAVSVPERSTTFFAALD